MGGGCVSFCTVPADQSAFPNRRRLAGRWEYLRGPFASADTELSLEVGEITVKQVVLASPDIAGGTPYPLEYSLENGILKSRFLSRLLGYDFDRKIKVNPPAFLAAYRRERNVLEEMYF